MDGISFIAVSGYFSSGSSAAVDLIREYRNTYECDAEIRIIKDPYGISQLETMLTDKWEFLNSAAAIRDYLWLCKICDRTKSNPFSPVGMSYAKKLNPEFMQLTHEYIEVLTDYTYQSDFAYQKFKKNYFHYIFDRWRMGIEMYSKGLIPAANRHNEACCFSHPTKDKFHEATKDYLEKVFSGCIGEGNGGYVILDQAISPNDTGAIYRYFRKAKLIIVDRDPRDMYVEDLVRWHENLDKDTSSTEAGLRYVMRHRALRESIPTDDPNILTIKFEDLVLKYDETKEHIEKFLGFSPADHINPNTCLKPKKSAKNIGIYKKYYNRYSNALEIIAKELPEYCHKG